MKKTKKTFSFDLDNTICKTNSNNYLKSKPYKKVIKLINNLYDNGHSIKILPLDIWEEITIIFLKLIK